MNAENYIVIFVVLWIGWCLLGALVDHLHKEQDANKDNLND